MRFSDNCMVVGRLLGVLCPWLFSWTIEGDSRRNGALGRWVETSWSPFRLHLGDSSTTRGRNCGECSVRSQRETRVSVQSAAATCASLYSDNQKSQDLRWLPWVSLEDEVLIDIGHALLWLDAATKLIAQIRQCDIVIRDANRIHHFQKNGQCCCGDHF